MSRATIRFLVREHRRKPFSGSVLLLGRQFTFATFAEVVQICREEGVRPCDVPEGVQIRSNIPAWHGTPLAENISDIALLHLLGAKSVVALDCSDHEGAELIHDLNQPVPKSWESRFDLIIDGGTMEHVFDVRRALMGIGVMLATGGRVVHMNPTNNYANHGFYQFSPTLFLDYYTANAFRDVRVYVAEIVGRDGRYAPCDVFRIDPCQQPGCMISCRPMLVLCVAEKGLDSTSDRVPLQACYQNAIASPTTTASPEPPEAEMRTPSLRETLKRFLPMGVRNLLRPYLVGEGHLKPWGCKRVGRLR